MRRHSTLLALAICCVANAQLGEEPAAVAKYQPPAPPSSATAVYERLSNLLPVPLATQQEQLELQRELHVLREQVSGVPHVQRVEHGR